MTQARIRRRFDLGRLRIAMAGAGADTRTWVTSARIDDDPDAISFDADVGWIVDVTFIGGDLAEEGPVPCRVAMSFGGDGFGELEPPALGCEVNVLINEGDPNANPIIIGYTDNGDGCGPPTVVAGFPVTELTAAGTHYRKSSHNIESEYAGSARAQADGGATVIAPVVTVAGALEAGGPPQPPAGVAIPTTTFPVFRVDESPLSTAPAESYVRGDQFAGDLDTFAQDLSVWVGAVGAMATAAAAASATLGTASTGVLLPLQAGFGALGGAFTALAAPTVTFQTAIATFRATLVPGTMLSEKIRGD